MSLSHIAQLIRGVALFLFGMSLMGDSLKQVAGSKLEIILYRLTGSPLKGALFGAGVTAVIQFSSATSVMVIGFVNAGVMTVKQAVSVILGAILGTSATGWVLCLSDIGSSAGILELFSTEMLTCIAALTGILLVMFSKKQQCRHVGHILLGFAILMVGMASMSGAVRPLQDDETFIHILTRFSNPVLGILAGAAFTAVLQSASAAVGILQALSMTGTVRFDTALPLIMSEALGEDVYHYHLHVVYIPVVEKQILWSKRCKDESLRGTVKETITRVNRSKKWESKPVLDKDGNPMLNAKGKKILKSFYGVLQDDFFHFMRNAGYTDVERGERGSTEEHLAVTQFKVQAEQQRLEAVAGQVAQAEQTLVASKAATEKQKKKLEALQKETKTAKTIALTVQDIEAMGKKSSITGNVSLTPDQCDTLKRYAVNGIIANADNKRLKEKLASTEKTVSIWKQRYEAGKVYRTQTESPTLSGCAGNRIRKSLGFHFCRTRQRKGNKGT